MIVTCERCATQFQLEDERVPEDGVRVRCSRCKHAFFIERPASNEAEKIHRIARRALQDVPGTTQDLDDAAEPPLVEDELDEEDWHFADDAPFGNEDDEDPSELSVAAAANVVDDLLGPEEPEEPEANTADAFSVSDLIGGADDPARSDDASHSLGPVDDELSDPVEDDAGVSVSFGSDDDAVSIELADDEPISLLDDDSPDASAEFQRADVEDLGHTDANLELDGPGPMGIEAESSDDASALLGDLRDDLAEEPASGPAPAEPAPAEPAPAEPAPAEPAPAEPAPATPRREVATHPSRRAPAHDELGDLDQWGLADERESPTVATGLTLPTRAVARVMEDLEDEPSPQALWLARAGNSAGWLFVVALFAVGLHGGVALQAAPPSLSPDVVRVGGFEVADVNTHWIDNLHVGPLLVVSGTVHNEAATETSGLQLLLLGADGEPLAEALSAVGPALGEGMLRGSHPDLYAAAQQELLADGWPWQPGQERRFHAVAHTVPDAATWLRFEVVEGAMQDPVPAAEPPRATDAEPGVPENGDEAFGSSAESLTPR